MKHKEKAHLRFESLSDAESHVRALHGVTVVTTGQWSAFRIYTHCADALEGTLRGFPKKPFPIWIRRTLGTGSFLAMRVLGYFPPKVPNVVLPHKAGEADPQAALARLISLIGDFERHEGPLAEHPFFGRLNKENWSRLHAWHLANHLSYIRASS